MDETQQAKVRNVVDQSLVQAAYEMLNCHLALAGRETLPSCQNEEISGCTSGLRGDHWNTYSLMFTHVQ